MMNEEFVNTAKTRQPTGENGAEHPACGQKSVNGENPCGAEKGAAGAEMPREEKEPAITNLLDGEIFDGLETADLEAEEGAATEPETETEPEAEPETETEVAKETEETAPQSEGPLPYHKRYYLLYGESSRAEPMDISGTKAFLQSMGFDGGELKQARECSALSEIFSAEEKGKMYCSYCGSEIAGVEFYRLPDGRLRCTACSRTIVKTVAEAEELCRRVMGNMETFFGASINVPVSIEFVEERKLKRRLGIPLGTKDSQSILILGVAINKNKKYSIIMENGAPRISLIATFAHELTHIWQYTNWQDKKKFPKCPKNKRLLIYEGMAKWAEIQYLYLVGETAVARREEHITRNRTDEYGVGFCLYEDRYPLCRDVMACDDTPFITTGYPIG